MPDLLDSYDEAVLSTFFDEGALARGKEVHRSRSVRRVRVRERSETDVVLEAEVWGSAPEPYDVDVRGEGRSRLTGYCTCPVRFNCKHVVATVLAARERSEPAERAGRAEWQRPIEGLLAAVEEPAETQVGLGLLLELKDDRRARRPAGPALFLRPVRPKASGTGWTRNGIAWDSLRRNGSFDQAQRRALLALQQAGRSPYGYSGGPLPAEDVGPALVPLLLDVRDAGVVLVGAHDRPARLLEERLDPVLDLTAAGDRLSVRLRVGDPEATDETDDGDGPDRLVLVGDPGHTVVMTTGPDDAQVLQVARLAQPLDTALGVMVRGGTGFTVPDADRAAFESGYLPRLRRHLRVGSSDRSVTIPEPARPRLVLGVDWASAATAVLTWRWRYVEGDHVEDLTPLEPSAVRRREDEQAIVRELRERLTDPARGLVMTPSQALASKFRVGPEQLLLLPPVLIEVAATGLVEVEATAPTPDFREVQGEAVIRFEAGGTVPETGGGDDERRDWLDLGVTVTVDGHPLPLSMLVEAMTKGQDKVFLGGGRYVSIARPELTDLADLIAEAADLADGEPGTLRVGAHDLGRWEQLSALGIVDHQAAEWVRSARQLARVDELPAVEPVGLEHALRPYQLAGFRWLTTLWRCGLGGVLADDMGLGKTLQALALISLARSEGAAPFLVVAPTSVVGAWVSEAAIHTPALDVRAVTGLEKRRGRTLAQLAEGADVVVTSYALLRMEAADYAALGWGGLVVDEAQMVKNHRGQTYDAVRRIEAPFRLAMTGTPFENRLLELWAVLSIAAPGLYPQPEDFLEQVAHPVERRHDEQALARFHRRVRPFLLRRTKDLVAPDLPPKQEQVLHVELGKQHRRVYDTHLQRERQKVLGLVEDFDKNRIAIFGALTRLRQLSLDAALVDEEYAAIASAKTELLLEQLSEVLGEGHRALVFSTFTGFLGRVRDRLEREGIATAYLDGSTRNRPAVIEAFKNGDAPVFLISLKAGGVGLTLTEADYVYVLDPWWNPAAEAQAVDRAHRIGQQRPVFVYRLIADDTIEEKVHELKERKAALFAQVIDGDGTGSAVLDADDVRALFD